MNSKNEAQKILYRYLIILIGVSILLGILHCIFGGVRVGRIWWFNLDKERNIATWFSGMLFFLFGCSAFFAYYLEKVRNAKGKSIFKFPWLWLGIGLAGLIMSLDEITILHENIGWRQIRLISENFGTAWIYVTQWQILFAPIIVLILTYFIIVFINRFSFSPRARHNVYIGIACWLIALFFEGIRGIIRVFDRDNYYILVLLEEELEMIGTIFFTASIIQYAIDISLNFKNNIKSSMRFLTKRTVVILVTVFIFISMAAGVIYFCAYKQAEDGAPLPTLYKRAKEQGSHFDTSYSKNYIGKFLLSIFMSEKKKLTPHILDMSLELGREFLLNNQKEEGSFTYKYNFITKKFSSSDSQVRQAGALWGLSLIHQLGQRRLF